MRIISRLRYGLSCSKRRLADPAGALAGESPKRGEGPGPTGVLQFLISFCADLGAIEKGLWCHSPLRKNRRPIIERFW